MFKLDDNLLQELGLGSLPAAEKNKMLSHIYETLEMRVGMKLAEQMSNEQLDEFEAFIERNDEPGALKWLETNFPGYKQVVADELEKLKGEIKTAAPQIVAASMQEAAMGVHQVPPADAPQIQTPMPYPIVPPNQQYAAPQPQYAPQAQPNPQYYQPPVPAAPVAPSTDPYALVQPPVAADPYTAAYQPPVPMPQPVPPTSA